MHTRLSTTPARPLSLDEPTLRELHRLKVKHLRVRADVGEELDYQEFREDCLWADLVLVARDQDGAAQGFYIVKETTIEHDFGAIQVLTADYGVLNHEYRGDFGFLASGLVFVLKRVARHPLRRKFFMAGAFPASYLLLRQMSKRCWTWRDPRLPKSLRGVFSAAAGFVFGEHWNWERGSVSTRVDPDPLPLSSRRAHPREFADYLASNADWAGGDALIVMIPIDARTAIGVARAGLGRMMRRFSRQRLARLELR